MLLAERQRKRRVLIDYRSYSDKAVHAMSGYSKEVLSVVPIGNK